MAWSPQQDEAIRAVGRWLRDPSNQTFYLAGYAGTGKTTLAKALAQDVRGPVLFGAFTGKAALVLRKKGCDGASTIHSLIYKIDEKTAGPEPAFVKNPFSVVRDAELVIIDECSMVDEHLGRDLLSFGTKVLVLGDPAQLPPVKGEGYFTARKPDLMLTEVHRQARDNPIIAMSMLIREGGRLEHGTYGSSRVVTRHDITSDDVLKTGQIVVGLNRTRRAYNARVRTLLGREGAMPEAGDRLVCLRNNREKHLLNGGLWTVAKPGRATGPTVPLHILSDDLPSDTGPIKVKVRREFFDGRDESLLWDDKKGTDEFTYGYALTCHKSQGSQWDDVVVFDEASAFRDEAWRWRYTAVTRAAERVTVVR